MDLRGLVKRFYFNMITNELRYMSDAPHTPNITYNSILYLDMIAYKENCTASFLAETLNVAKSAVTLKINNLVRQGLVTKTRSAADKRVFYLSVTGRVTEEYEYYNACLHSAVSEIEREYSRDEITVFSRILDRIGNHIAEGTGYYDAQHTVSGTDKG